MIRDVRHSSFPLEQSGFKVLLSTEEFVNHASLERPRCRQGVLQVTVQNGTLKRIMNHGTLCVYIRTHAASFGLFSLFLELLTVGLDYSFFSVTSSVRRANRVTVNRTSSNRLHRDLACIAVERNRRVNADSL